MSARIIFAGTPPFAAQHLSALIEHQIIPLAVYTQPDRPAGRGRASQASPVKELAEQYQIPCLQPLSLKGIQEQQQLADLQPDLMIVVAYGLILPTGILQTPSRGCINVHASLLPKWRGAAPIQRAIEAGDKETGITIMQMEQGLDTGEMLHTKTTPIGNQDTAADLHDRLAQLGAQALIEILPAVLNGTAQPQPQNEALATYASKLTKQEGLIHWAEPAQLIDQKIRAFTPWPGAQTDLKNNRVKIKARFYSDQRSSATAGTIVAHNAEGLIVNCGDGQILVQQIQFPGKRMTDVNALMNAYEAILAVGESFQ